MESRSARTRVHSLGQRRRQRRNLVLVAAAAAVIVGIAVPAVNHSQSSGDSGASSSVTEDSGSADSGSADSDSAGSTASQAPSAAQDQAAPSSGLEGPLVLTASTFDDDVRRVALSRSAAKNQLGPSDLSLVYDGCPGADYGRGELFAATYDGALSVLALRPALGDVRVAELLACGTAELIRRTTVPVG